MNMQEQAQKDIKDRILKYTYMLIEALKDNYKKSSQNNGIDFEVEEGRKYYKVVHIWTDNFQRGVHCFIDKKTGGVFKPASWSSPAKGERFNLLLIKDRELLLENADWCGRYLYVR